MNSPLIPKSEIENYLPHRAGMLLLDEVLKIELPEGVVASEIKMGVPLEGTNVVALKNLTRDEFFFKGHFPFYPVVPGVLLVEMMAQASSFARFPYEKNPREFNDHWLGMLVGVNDARFRHQAVPGDQLQIKAKLKKARGKLLISECRVTCGEHLVAEAEILIQYIDRKKEGI